MQSFQSNIRLALVSSLAALMLGALTQSALAHAHLKSETPAANAVVSPAPDALVLLFSEEIEVKLTHVTVTGPGKIKVPAGPLALDPADATRLTVPLTGPLGPGKYSVDWHAVSTDSHNTNGSYSFTVKP